jgi:hypothetical protein
MLKMRTFCLEQHSNGIVPFEKLNIVLLAKPLLIVDLVLSRVSLETLLMLKMRTLQVHSEQHSYDIVLLVKLKPRNFRKVKTYC